MFPLKSKVKIFVLLVFLCIWQILFFTIVLTLIPKLFWGSRVQIGLLFTGIAVDRHSVFVFLSCAQSLSSFFSAFHLPQFFVLSYLLWFVFTFPCTFLCFSSVNFDFSGVWGGCGDKYMCSIQNGVSAY